MLKEKIDNQIERLRRKKSRDKGKTTRIVITGGVTSAATTALLGISKFYPAVEAPLQIIAIALSAFLTIVLTWDALFNHKGLWLLSAKTLWELYDLRDDMEHAAKTESIRPELVQEFYNKYKDIISRRNKSWNALRSND